MKQTRDWWNTVTLILYKRYTIKSKLTYLKHQVIFKLYETMRPALHGVRFKHSNRFYPSVEQIHRRTETSKLSK